MALPNGLPQISDIGKLQGSLGYNIVDIPLMTSTTATGTPADGTFHSTVANRAPMYDLRKDLSVNSGGNRIQVQQIYKIQNEFGPTGETVWGTVNDNYGQIRFVGDGWTNDNDVNGPMPLSPTANDYVEITFYGTGINMLTLVDSTARDFRASIDGVEGVSNVYIAGSSVLNSRFYKHNQPVNLFSNQSLGVHTVKVRLASAGVNIRVDGFEILNESSSIKVNPGTSWKNGQKLYNPAQAVLNYNSDFESGTLGIRGGRVAVYQKANGSIAKAVTPTDSQLTLSSTNHVNEEVVRIHHWREFGSSRSGNDDFSINVGSLGTRTFTLEDNTTNLVGNNVNQSLGVGIDNVGPASTGDSYTISFVGTGLDLISALPDSGTLDSSSVTIDGVNVGNITFAYGKRVNKICSGLSYGTHVVKLTRNAVIGYGTYFSHIIIYQPKTPNVPSDANQLGAYNIMADYITSTAGILNIATGVLRKHNKREFVYINGTGGSIDWIFPGFDFANFIAGEDVRTDRTGASYAYTFTGTGCELRGLANTDRKNGNNVTLNGLAATVANFPSLVSSQFGGWTFSAGVLNLNAATQGAAGVKIAGLPYGTYTIKVTSTNSTSNVWLNIDCIDIITPIHSHKIIGKVIIQNTLSVGSQGIEDNRLLVADISDSVFAKATGVSTSPTLTSTGAAPIHDMNLTVKTTKKKITVSFATDHRISVVENILFDVYIDGVQRTLGSTFAKASPGVGFDQWSAWSTSFYLQPGYHEIIIMGYSASGTITWFGQRREMIVTESD